MNGLLGYAALGQFLLGAIPSGETPPVTVLGPIDVIGLAMSTPAAALTSNRATVSGLQAKKPNLTGWEQH